MAEESSTDLRRLRDASERLMSTDDLSSLCQLIVTEGMALLGCGAAVLWLVDRPGRHLYRAAAAGLEGRTYGYMQRLPFEDTLEGRVLATGANETGMLIESRAAGYRPLLGAGLRSGLSAPVSVDSTAPLGVLSFLHEATGRFTRGDREIAEAFAATAGEALQGLRRTEERDHAARIYGETLCPTVPPQARGLDVAVAVETGGQRSREGRTFYDVLDLSGGCAIAYAELAGSASSEQGFAVMTRGMLRENAAADPSPASVAGRLNDALCDTFGRELLVHLVYALFDPDSKTLSVVNAGAWPPILAGRSGLETIESSGVVLGAYPGELYSSVDVSLHGGDLFVGWTNAIPETWSRRGDPPMDVLCDIVRRHDGTPNSLVEALRTKAQAAADGPLAAGAIALAVRVADV